MSLLGGFMLRSFSFSLMHEQSLSLGHYKFPTHAQTTSFLHLFSGPAPGGQASWAWVFVPDVESECWVWRPVSWALEGGPEEDNPSVPTPRPHTADTHCAGMAAGWAALPFHHTPDNAAPVPCSSCWTGEERRT